MCAILIKTMMVEQFRFPRVVDASILWMLIKNRSVEEQKKEKLHSPHLRGVINFACKLNLKAKQFQSHFAIITPFVMVVYWDD